MEEKERVRRSTEEIVAEIDKETQYHNECISALQKKKAAALNPKTRKARLTTKKIFDYAKAQGMTMEEIAKKLGYKEEK